MKDWTEQINQMRFSIDDIKDYPANELVELLYESTNRCEFFNVIEVPLNMALASKRELTLDDIKEFFDLQTGVAERNYGFPVLRQRKEAFYQEAYFGSPKPNALPAHGFAWTVDYDLKKPLPFGIITIEPFIRQEKRRTGTGDLRHTADNFPYRETKHFYYDYIKEQYIQVDVKNSGHPNTQTYYSRLDSINYCYSIFENENKLYVKRLNELYKSMTNYMQQTSTSVNSTGEYLDVFKKFKPVLEGVRDNLLMKLLYTHISLDEYEYFKTKIPNLINRIDDSIQKFNTLRTKINLEYSIEKYNDKAERKRLNLLLKNESITFSEWAQDNYITEIDSLKNSYSSLLKELLKWIKRRNEKTPFDSWDGYLDIVKRKLIPNLIKIEERYFLTDSYDSEESIKEKEKMLVNVLTSNKESNEEPIELTREEELQIEYQMPSMGIYTAEAFYKLALTTDKNSLKVQLLKAFEAHVKTLDADKAFETRKFKNTVIQAYLDSYDLIREKERLA